MRYKNTDAVPVKERCSSWRPSDRYLPYANAECLGTKECDPCKCNGDEEKCDYYENVRKRGAEKKKATDVVEVVRCKDCKHWERGVCHCPEHRYLFTEKNHYCGYGERSNENAE